MRTRLVILSVYLLLAGVVNAQKRDSAFYTKGMSVDERNLLHLRYQAGNADVYIKLLLHNSTREIPENTPEGILWEQIRYGCCSEYVYDLIWLVAIDKPDTVTWLCKTLLDSFTAPHIVDGKVAFYRSSELIFNFAKKYNVKLDVGKCLAMIDGLPSRDPVTDILFLRLPDLTFGPSVVSYLLSLKNKKVTSELLRKVRALYRQADMDISQSEEYKEFKKYGIKI